MEIETEFLNNYQDRGIIKYFGFYLSDHMLQLGKDKSERYSQVDVKEIMTENEIYRMIEKAILEYSLVSIQLNAKDIKANFEKNIIGQIEGIEEGFIFINKKPVEISSVRHIEIIDKRKWFK